MTKKLKLIVFDFDFFLVMVITKMGSNFSQYEENINEHYDNLDKHYKNINKRYEDISKNNMKINTQMAATLLRIHKRRNPTKKEDFEKAISTCEKVSKLIDEKLPIEDIRIQDTKCEELFKNLEKFMTKPVRKQD